MTVAGEPFFFRFESEMVRPVRSWLLRHGYAVAEEFQTNEGVADLVACRWDQERLNIRHKQLGNLKFRSKISSILWWSLPAGDSVATVDWLAEMCGCLASRDAIVAELRWLDSKALIETDGSFIRRGNQPWYPVQREVVAVELKLSRITSAVRQAIRYRAFATSVYVALPLGTAQNQSRQALELLRRSGVGLLGVDLQVVETLVEASPEANNSVHQFLVAERLLSKVTGNSSSTGVLPCSPAAHGPSPMESLGVDFLAREQTRDPETRAELDLQGDAAQ